MRWRSERSVSASSACGSPAGIALSYSSPSRLWPTSSGCDRPRARRREARSPCTRKSSAATSRTRATGADALRHRTARRRYRMPRDTPASASCGSAPVNITPSRPAAASRTRGSSGPVADEHRADVLPAARAAALEAPTRGGSRRASCGRRRQRPRRCRRAGRMGRARSRQDETDRCRHPIRARRSSPAACRAGRMAALGVTIRSDCAHDALAPPAHRLARAARDPAAACWTLG